MATWLLPDNMADILPQQMRVLEKMRRTCLDLFASHGFEQVEPPMIEFVSSLLTGSGSDLDNNTFKFMDQANGRMVGLRADITPQIARIDAHILNSTGVSRLCYAATCLHARPLHPLASREPFVAGAELFGCSGEEADRYMIRLAVKTLRLLGVEKVHVDIGHTAIVRALLAADRALNEEELHALLRALRMKDPTALESAAATLKPATHAALSALLTHFGDASVIDELEKLLPASGAVQKALAEARELGKTCGEDEVSFYFCDVHGYQYLTGATFSVNIPQYAQAVLRGGRYDGVGLAFGRPRPACGFTVYLRELSAVLNASEKDIRPEAVLADATVTDKDYRREVEKLRACGKIVISLLPGESPLAAAERFTLTHELVRGEGSVELRVIKPRR